MKEDDKDKTADEMEAEILEMGDDAEKTTVPVVKDDTKTQKPVKKEEEVEEMLLYKLKPMY